MKVVMIWVMALTLMAQEDGRLVLLAYDHGLRGIPNSFETLLYDLNETQEHLSREKIRLGKRLFFDANLSLGRDISCASCHRVDRGGADGLPTAVGHLGRKNPFHLNTPTVLSTAFSKTLFWDGRSKALQDQAKGPLQAPFEMAITPELAVARMQEHPTYIEAFVSVYGGEITFDRIVDAIAAYEKTLHTRGRYDDFLLGYVDALTSREKRGLALFITKGCVGCHNGPGLGGQTLRKFPLAYHPIWSMLPPDQVNDLRQTYQGVRESLLDMAQLEDRERFLQRVLGKENITRLAEGFFHRIDSKQQGKIMASSGCTTCHLSDGIRVKAGVNPYPFENRGGFQGEEQRQGYVRVPLLRNIIHTAPYFHNGSVSKLEEAVELMGIHQLRLRLSKEEVAHMVDFLKAVDGDPVDYGVTKAIR